MVYKDPGAAGLTSVTSVAGRCFVAIHSLWLLRVFLTLCTGRGSCAAEVASAVLMRGEGWGAVCILTKHFLLRVEVGDSSLSLNCHFYLSQTMAVLAHLTLKQ